MEIEKQGFEWRISVQSFPLFISCLDILIKAGDAIIQSGQNKFELLGDLISSVYDKRLVVIDDLAPDGQPVWAQMVLFNVLDRRYRANKRTLITSGKTIEELRGQNLKIASRIAGMCLLRRVD